MASTANTEGSDRPGIVPEYCAPSPPSPAYPTDTDVFGARSGADWFCSVDRELCAVKSGEWFAGGWKVGWHKPLGSALTLQGSRLDAEAPPLGASIPDGYPGRFQSTAMIFPTEGCWEVRALAAESELTFTLMVSPPHQEPRGGACGTLAEAVENSDGIIIGTIRRSYPGPDGRYLWHDVQIYRAWKNPEAGDALMLLQDTLESPALAAGRRYVLFMQRDPFQIFCPQQTLVEVLDGELQTLPGLEDENLLWTDHSAEALQKTIRLLVFDS